MSILKATKDGQHCTSVQPDTYTKKTVEELKANGWMGIHNPETGEQY